MNLNYERLELLGLSKEDYDCVIKFIEKHKITFLDVIDIKDQLLICNDYYFDVETIIFDVKSNQSNNKIVEWYYVQQENFNLNSDIVPYKQYCTDNTLKFK